jgi:hypothetical protein
LQIRHLPFRRIKLSIGILSIIFIGVLHSGHLDDGMIIEIPLGILYMQTFMNEPMAKPKIKVNV